MIDVDKITVQCGNNATDGAKIAIEKLNECLDNGFYQVAEYKNGELMITVSDPPVKLLLFLLAIVFKIRYCILG